MLAINIGVSIVTFDSVLSCVISVGALHVVGHRFRKAYLCVHLDKMGPRVVKNVIPKSLGAQVL